MKFVILLSFIFLSSCESKRESIIHRQDAIKQKMKEVSLDYYKKLDSLEIIKRADTSFIKQNEIAEEISSTDNKRSMELLKLQKESDSLELELMK